jgi:hypothetical protein
VEARTTRRVGCFEGGNGEELREAWAAVDSDERRAYRVLLARAHSPGSARSHGSAIASAAIFLALFPERRQHAPAPSVLSAVPSIDGRGEAADDAQPEKGSPRAGQPRRPLETVTAAGASGQGVPLAMGTLPRRAPLRPHGRRAAAPSEVTAPAGP